MGFEVRDYEILKNNFFAKELLIYKDVFFKLPQIIKDILSSDLVFCWFAYRVALIPLLIAKVLRKKIIVVIGGWECASQPENDYGAMRPGFKFLLARSFVRSIATLSDKIIAVSKYNEQEIITNIRPSLEKISLIYLGIPTDCCQGQSLPKDNLVLTVANVTVESFKRKGIDIFIKAARLLSDTKFVLAGEIDKESSDYLRDNLPQNLTLTGFVGEEQLHKLYQQAKVYVQVSYHEQFGVALAEAMAHGCVPVVSQRTALPEVVGSSGYYVPYADIDRTIEAIKEALRDGQRGEIAKQRIKEEFSLKKREESLVNLIKNLV
jgi:glycosyltransferase involved in cell wall biosynthesis